MIYRIVFYNRSIDATWSAGVYAPTTEEAKQIGAILMSRKYNYPVPAEKCHVLEIPGMTSTVMTTT